MPSLSTLLCVCLVVVANAVPHKHLKSAAKAKAATKLVGSMEFKYRLRVCNAYPNEDDLEIYKGHSKYPHAKEEKLTKVPMEYKKCGDFHTDLLAGDKLKFFVGGGRAGTFTISDMPDNDAVLLLVVHRHDTMSTAVAFQSHVFANLLNAQVAILDTYKGSAHGTPVIQDGGKAEEKVHYNNVVALSPGEYKVGFAGAKVAKAPFVALNGESYIVLRVGVEANEGHQYPQELVVYPKSDARLLHSAAPQASMCMTLLIGLLAASGLRQ